MSEDHDDLRLAFTVAITDALRTKAREDIALLPFLAHLVRGLRDGFPQQEQVREGPTGAPPSVAAALPATGIEPALAELIGPIADITTWRPVAAKHPDVPVALQQGLYSAHVYGAMGALGCEKMRAGLFSIAPGIKYPPHTHTAPELYFCLSGELTLTHGVDGKPFTIGPGEYSITPRGRLHSLETKDKPVLLYFAWVNDFSDPMYFWEEDGEGNWTRAVWKREPNGSWTKGDAEPVSPDQIAEQTLNEGH